MKKKQHENQEKSKETCSHVQREKAEKGGNDPGIIEN